MSTAAIITADIVNWTQLSKGDAKKIMGTLEEAFAGTKFEFYRGDSFQVYVKSAGDALALVMQARAASIKIRTVTSLSAADIRASIGIGAVKLPLKELKTATGEAFILSGRAFDELKAPRRLSITCPENYPMQQSALRLIAQFTDYLFQRLTVKQAAVVLELLMKRTQVETARRLKKSQATINKHAQSAGWTEIEKLMAEYQNIINTINA